MKVIRVGVVAEGPSDCVVLDQLLSGYFSRTLPAVVALKFKNVQPYVDNTSNSGYSEGGWEQVYKWCLSNPPGERENAFFGPPLFADDMDDMQCDVLMVHMDADICGAIGSKSSITPIPSEGSLPAVRGKFISDTVQAWLWPDGIGDQSRHIIVPAVESTEAWLVAGLSNEDSDPENDHDIERRLAELDYLLVKVRPVPKGIKKPNKSAANYAAIARHAVKNVMRIAARCDHFRSAVDKIMVAATQLPDPV